MQPVAGKSSGDEDFTSSILPILFNYRNHVLKALVGTCIHHSIKMSKLRNPNNLEELFAYLVMVRW